MAKVAKAKAPKLPAEPSKSELTRQRILDAAAKVFATRGYAHTRLADVAREAGSHAGGIYYYFDSREALVDEVLRISTQRAIDQVTAALKELPPEASASEKLMVVTTAQLSGIMRHDPYDLAHNRIYPQIPDDVRLRHADLLHDFFDIWREIIAEGQATGQIRHDVDPAVLRLTVAGSIQWATEWADGTQGSPEQLARKMVDIFLRGALTPEAASRAFPV